MGAPEGNKFALGNDGGNDFKFTPKDFDLAWQQYFQYTDETPWIKHEVLKSGERAGELIPVPVAQPYTEFGFCAFHNLGDRYLYKLSKTIEKHLSDPESTKKHVCEELGTILSQARARCKAQKFAGAAVGAFNANLIAKDLEMVSKTENLNENTNMNVNLTKDEMKEIHDALNSEF